MQAAISKNLQSQQQHDCAPLAALCWLAGCPHLYTQQTRDLNGQSQQLRRLTCSHVGGHLCTGLLLCTFPHSTYFSLFIEVHIRQMVAFTNSHVLMCMWVRFMTMIINNRCCGSFLLLRESRCWNHFDVWLSHHILWYTLRSFAACFCVNHHH